MEPLKDKKILAIGIKEMRKTFQKDGPKNKPNPFSVQNSTVRPKLNKVGQRSIFEAFL